MFIPQRVNTVNVAMEITNSMRVLQTTIQESDGNFVTYFHE